MHFFYDIVVYNKSDKEHLQHLDVVINVLLSNNFILKPASVFFFVDSIECVGHIVLLKGVSLNPNKVEGVQNWAIPTSLKQLRAFLGLLGYSRQFIKEYAAIAHPLTNML